MVQASLLKKRFYTTHIRVKILNQGCVMLYFIQVNLCVISTKKLKSSERSQNALI